MGIKQFTEKLKQPSTYKAIVIILGIIGYEAEIADVETIIISSLSLYAVISALWDKG